MPADPLALLRTAISDPNAQFRPGQWEAVDAIVNRRARLLVVERTGWGKSLVYFLGTRLLRERGAGATLLISPLLALMRNQIAAAGRIGIRALTINSTNQADWAAVERRVLGGQCDLLLISPERLANDGFRERCLLPLAQRIGLLVVDEAHCISDWGHDFRPDYQRIARILRLLPANLPVLATTATANDRVVNDIQRQVGPTLLIQRGPLTRATLRLQNIWLRTAAERMAWIAHQLPQLPGSGIIYTLTVRDSQLVAEWLRSRGISAASYHGGMENDEREFLEDLLLSNRVKVLVATVALGMGFDKPDLGFVIHYQRPGSVVHYYQQVGRAGRAVDDAYGVLLNGEEDDQIAEYFIHTAFPSTDQVSSILDVLRASPAPLAKSALEQRVDVASGVLDKILKFLLLESPSPIQRVGTGYAATAVKWSMPRGRIARITDQRRYEQARMQAYMVSRDCLMQFLAEELNDPQAAPCGRCVNCTGRLLSMEYPPELARAAVEFLKRLDLPIPPRRRWPAGFDFEGSRGAIPFDHQAEVGRALCRWGDPGYGELVRAGKQDAGAFDEALIEAAVALVRDRWHPQPAPRWVTSIPSANRPALVSNLARRLAARLHIPYIDCVSKTRNTPPQKTLRNSYHQAKNVAGALQVNAARTRREPVLLVDDMVDSRWTFTLAAVLLRRAGAGPVFPFALADSSGDDGE